MSICSKTQAPQRGVLRSDRRPFAGGHENGESDIYWPDPQYYSAWPLKFFCPPVRSMKTACLMIRSESN